jgi:uncharacterized Zn finger protein
MYLSNEEKTMPFPQMTEALIQHAATPEIVERGRAYYEQERVTSLVLRGTTLYAEVEGNEEFPYLVRCTFGADNSVEASCTCPYDWGGWCKHIVAVCLSLIHAPETIEQRPSLESQISLLTREQLQTVLLTLAERDPSLVETIEREADLIRLVTTEPAPRPQAKAPLPVHRMTLDPKAVSR